MYVLKYQWIHSSIILKDMHQFKTVVRLTHLENPAWEFYK
jgi:hypothetical protein